MRNLDESLLAGIPPFRRLSAAQIRRVFDLAEPKRFDPESRVFAQGEEARFFFLLLDGHIRVVRTNPDGEQIIPLHIVSGQLFGIAPALGHSRYPATAVTADECLTLRWPAELWDDFVRDCPGFATETYKVVGERFEQIHDKTLELATQQVETRVATALLRLVRQSGKEVDGGIMIDFPITRQNISDMTGATLHTISRLLSAWEKHGIISSKRRQIVVTDPHQLVLLSESSSP